MTGKPKRWSTIWRSIKDDWAKVLLSILAFALAIIRLYNFEYFGQRMDLISLALLLGAIFIFVIPWDRLRSFKAGDFEFTLDRPQVKGALDGIKMERFQGRRLRKTISQLELDIAKVKGGRILWIDNKPHEILGERRLLRALDIEVVTVKNINESETKLKEDNDFDLIIINAQVDKEDKGMNGRGIYFAKRLRDGLIGDVFKETPIIFYPAKKEEIIINREPVIQPIFEKHKFVDTIEELLVEVIEELSEIRSNPVKVSSRKKETSV